jgi:hypothetical protein
VVEGNALVVTDLVANRDYYWRITPYNAYSYCAPISEVGTFSTTDVSSVAAINQLTSLRVFPQPVGGGNALTVDFTVNAQINGRIRLFNSLGQPLQETALNYGAGRHTLKFPTAQLAAGLYFLSFQTAEGQAVQQIVVE